MTEGIEYFRLPDAGEGLTEAEILRWTVAPGDEVTVNQIVVEVETAKAVVELPSPYAGRVAELLVEEGTTVAVGTPIIAVDTGGGAGRAPEDADVAAAPSAPSEAESEAADGAAGTGAETPQTANGRTPVLVGYGVKEAATRRRPRRSRTGDTTEAAPASAGAATANGTTRPSVVPAKPPVRKLAKDLGVDLATVRATGPGGVVTREDVQRAAAPEAAPAPSARSEREERIPVKGVRKHTAAAMVESAFSAPHVTEFLQIDATESVEAVNRLKQRPEFADVKISPLLLVAKALITVARRYPLLNSTWDADAGEIVVKHDVNLGIAAATERGLVVPNIKEAQTLSLPELARTLGELTETARAGKAAPADLSGGTISITNVGVFGVDAGTPILNPGEAAILAFGQIRDLPWVHRGELAVRKVTTLALSFDHRIVDGELGSKALRDLGQMLEDPLTALAWS